MSPSPRRLPMSKRRGTKALQQVKLVELPQTIEHEHTTSAPLTTTTTFTAEPLPATPECENCAELRRLLAGMRQRVDEVEFEYSKLATERNALLAKLSGSAPEIEIVS